MRKILLSFLSTALVSFYIIYSLIPEPPVTKVFNTRSTLKQESSQSTPNINFENQTKKLPVYLKINNVPFIMQAPFAEWKDIRQQEACEEASILMALYWSEDKPLSKIKAKEEILNMVEFETQNFGYFIHTDVEDTNKILTEYYNFKKSAVIHDVDLSTIKQALADNKLVVAPMNGKKLKNPNFLNGGPENHMILIIGYDEDKQVFITHDPGTRKGKDYEYSYQTIQDSIFNYSSSTKPENSNQKSIIVVSKNSN